MTSRNSQHFLPDPSRSRWTSAQGDATLPNLRQIAMGELLQIHGQAAGLQDLCVPVLATKIMGKWMGKWMEYMYLKISELGPLAEPTSCLPTSGETGINFAKVPCP